MSQPANEKQLPKMPKGYIDIEPLSDEEEKIHREVMMTFTDEELEDWARQLEEERNLDERAKKEPRA